MNSLTEILTQDANRLFTEEISSDIWRETSEKLGFAQAEAEEFLTLATEAVRIASQPKEEPPIKLVNKKLRGIIGTTTAIIGFAMAASICAPVLLPGRSTVTIMDENIPLAAAPVPAEIAPPPAYVSPLTLRYCAGSEVAGKDILLDASVIFAMPDGEAPGIEIKGFENIDFNLPGEYPVRVTFGGDDNHAREIIVIVVA